ncbi:ABC transporter substrate-binding protein [Polyangium mundeleinium]|uniref:ABC transporter substrate-binding protein n=1 Tax=Polyangium mundeleinium TaxID=2995306 RepID=A0ABT5F571_9BACT|nr:ABC transporter substrate-binding protein [Polyangium mundeleinium]MDC0749101.1 ABC transporter substrate-binding protein [Polyangium mundeleinium]
MSARLRRRDALITLASSFAALAGAGCARGGKDGEASLWFAYGGTNREVLLSLVNRFNAEQTTYRIKAIYQGDYFEALAKLRTAIAARTAPALTHVVGEVVPYLAQAGTLLPIDETHHVTGDVVPALGQTGCFVRGGERPIVCAPFNRSTPIAYYNRAIFDELGLHPPTTWSELESVARAATVRANDGTVTRHGFACPIDWWFWVALVGQAGGTVVEDDGTPSLGGEAGVRALEFWQRLVHEERTMKPPPGRDYNAWQATNTDFLAGRVAMIWTSTAFLKYLETNAKFPVGAAPLPGDVRRSVPTGGTMFVVPAASSEHERPAARAFLQWMMQPRQANEWATRTGYLPVSQKGLAELEASGYYREHPNDRVALDQLKDAFAWPWAPTLFRIQREAVQPRLEEAVLARRDARATLDEARRAAGEP